MRLDSILEKELKNRLQKENRAVVFVTRVKMMVLFEGVEWQPNCSGLLVLYQKKYSHGFTILDASNFDVNFDFELYSNFQSYTKYFPDTFSLAFMAPSSEKSLKIMFLFENKAELVEIKKHLDRIFNPNTGKIDIDFFNQP